MIAYRDDLEAARLRGDDLERELADVRRRNQELEAKLAERTKPQPSTDQTVLMATRGGRLVTSLVIGGLGITTVGAAFAEGATGVALFFTILCGSLLAYLYGVTRVDPAGRK